MLRFQQDRVVICYLTGQFIDLTTKKDKNGSLPEFLMMCVTDDKKEFFLAGLYYIFNKPVNYRYMYPMRLKI